MKTWIKIGIGFVALGSTVLGQDRPTVDPARQCCEITVDRLGALGLHLPSYMSTIDELDRYEHLLLQTIQTIRIQWESMPGQKEIVPKNIAELDRGPSSFVLLEREHNVKGGIEGFRGLATKDVLINVGVTATNEIRGLSMLRDPRLINSEGPVWELINPTVQFDISLPDDPYIQRVLFLSPKSDHGIYVLKKLGELDLSTAKPSKGAAVPK